jgi:hypothetical protein
MAEDCAAIVVFPGFVALVVARCHHNSDASVRRIDWRRSIPAPSTEADRRGNAKWSNEYACFRGGWWGIVWCGFLILVIVICRVHRTAFVRCGRGGQ